VQVTLWGDFATNQGDQLAAAVSAGQHPTLALKGGRVGDFNGKNLSTIHSSQVGDCCTACSTRLAANWWCCLLAALRIGVCNILANMVVAS